MNRVLYSVLLAAYFFGVASPAFSSTTVSFASSFQALEQNVTTYPPDTMGAAGPSHLMITLNSEVRIQNKTGGNLSTTDIDDWWSSRHSAVTRAFDPRVYYDSLSGRWVFIAVANSRDATSMTLVAVSASSDPTGSWYSWTIDADSSDTYWADYPTLGINNKWITIAANMYTVSGDSFGGVKVWVINKTEAYANADPPTFTAQSFTGVGGTLFPALTMDSDQDTQYLINSWSSGLLRLYTVTGSANSPVFSLGEYVAVSSWDSDFSNAPQSGTTTTIRTNDDRIHSVLVRDSVLWCAHTVGLPASSSTHTAIRWYRINPATGLMLTEGTIDTYDSDSMWYYFPSLAVNKNGQAVFGFSGSSSSSYAGAYYAIRSGTSGEAGTPVQFKAGEGTYTTGRWGDYSGTCVDPSDDLTFWTIQEYAETGNEWGTWWAKFVASDEPLTFTAPALPDLPLSLAGMSLALIVFGVYALHRRRKNR